MRWLTVLLLFLSFVFTSPANAVCPIVTEGGIQRELCDKVYDGDVTFNGTVNIPGSISDPAMVAKTTAPVTYYVRIGGNDGNDCISVPTACLTVQGAIDKVPQFIEHLTQVDIGAGTFAEHVVIAGKVVGAAGHLSVFGSMTQSTLATGTASGTSTGGTTTYLEDSGQSWTVNDLKGRFLLIDGAYYTILSNTATRIDIVSIHWATMSGKAYEIHDPETIIQSTTNWQPIFHIRGILGSATNFQSLTLSQLRLVNTGNSYGVWVYDSGISTIQNLQVIDPFWWGISVSRVTLTNIYEVYVEDATVAGFNFTFITDVRASGLMADGGGTPGSQWGHFYFRNVYTIDGLVAVANGNVGGPGFLFFNCSAVSPRKLQANNNATDGVFARYNTVFSKGGFADSGTFIGSGNTNFGVNIGPMSNFSFRGPSTTMTGTSGDLTLDGGATPLDWTTDFPADGSKGVNPNDFCRVERDD